jgi:hypothetical protein
VDRLDASPEPNAVAFVVKGRTFTIFYDAAERLLRTSFVFRGQGINVAEVAQTNSSSLSNHSSIKTPLYFGTFLLPCLKVSQRNK